MRALGLAALACAVVVAFVVLTRDPEEPWAVALLVLSLGGIAGALATWLQLRRRGRGRRVPRVATVAGRRGLEVAAIVAIVLWLRVVDGLSVITAVFVVGTFLAAEVILATRPNSSR